MKIWSILDAWMTQPEVVRDQRWINLYPSEASIRITNKWGEEETQGTCQRKAWLRFKVAQELEKDLTNDIAILQVGEDTITVMPEKADAKREWIFEEGRRVESTVLDIARSTGICRAGHRKFKVPIADELCLVGELDGIFQVSGELVGIEIKSVSGYNAERDVFGTAAARRAGMNGKPKVQHLLQTAVYAWHYRQKIPRFSLMYFLRGSSLRTEFEVTVQEDYETSDFHIMVDGQDSGITINQIIGRYRELAGKLDRDELPDREYTLHYDDDKMNKALERGQLNRTKKAQWEKYWDRKTNGGRQVKRPEHGDIECVFCPYTDVCYDSNKQPIEYNSVPHVDVASEADVDDGVRCGDSGGSSGDLRPISDEMAEAIEEHVSAKLQHADDEVPGTGE
jgi:hypothetical protein